ncbi:MAG: hypothetical protein LBN95_12965 [Prevotellaceae bacterium]|jgi:hypothetical protein|nr:hypothetical protein [Prevotellaceae bacterium]
MATKTKKTTVKKANLYTVKRVSYDARAGKTAIKLKKIALNSTLKDFFENDSWKTITITKPH